MLSSLFWQCLVCNRCILKGCMVETYNQSLIDLEILALFLFCKPHTSKIPNMKNLDQYTLNVYSDFLQWMSMQHLIFSSENSGSTFTKFWMGLGPSEFLNSSIWSIFSDEVPWLIWKFVVFSFFLAWLLKSGGNCVII